MAYNTHSKKYECSTYPKKKRKTHSTKLEYSPPYTTTTSSHIRKHSLTNPAYPSGISLTQHHHGIRWQRRSLPKNNRSPKKQYALQRNWNMVHFYSSRQRPQSTARIKNPSQRHESIILSRAPMYFYSKMAKQNSVTSMSPKLQKQALDIHKPEHHITPVQKCGRICPMTPRAIYGPWDVSSMKWLHYARHLKQRICLAYIRKSPRA